MVMMVAQRRRGQQKWAGGGVRMRAHHLHTVHRHPLIGDVLLLLLFLRRALRLFACIRIIVYKYFYFIISGQLCY